MKRSNDAIKKHLRSPQSIELNRLNAVVQRMTSSCIGSASKGHTTRQHSTKQTMFIDHVVSEHTWLSGATMPEFIDQPSNRLDIMQ